MQFRHILEFRARVQALGLWAVDAHIEIGGHDVRLRWVSKGETLANQIA